MTPFSSTFQSQIHFGDPRLPDRFWTKVVVVDSGCWEWQAKRSFDGYGVFKLERRPVRAHRLTYQILVGPISPSLEIDHLCRNPACVLPAHLEAVTHRENMLRGVSPVARRVRQAACMRGHVFDKANTYIAANRSRHCRRCTNQRARIQYWANPEKERARKRQEGVQKGDLGA